MGVAEPVPVLPDEIPLNPPKSNADQPAGTITNFQEAVDRREEEIAAKAREIVEDLKFTGAYQELSLEREAYFQKLDEIADVPEDPEKDFSNEGITRYEKDLLIAISVARMNQADASENAKEEQKKHLEEVYDIVTGAARLETRPVDLKKLQRSALLHDCGKFCATMKKGEVGIEVVLSDDSQKKEKNIPKANPDLWGHNAHSALEAVSILQRLDPAFSKIKALNVGKAILTHSDDEFPDEFALVKGQFVEHRNNYDAYNMFGTLFIRSREDAEAPKSLEDDILHAGDMIVGVGTGSYFKYLEQHVNNPQLVKEDTETVNDRGWTRLQAAVQTCFETSANNFFKAPHSLTRELYGKKLLAEAEAFREWFRRYTSDMASPALNALPNAAEIQAAVQVINTGDYASAEDRKNVVDAYAVLLRDAREYAQARKVAMESDEEGSFTREYSRKFVEEHSVVLDDEEEYWDTVFNVDAISSDLPADKAEAERLVRSRKKEWKLKNTHRLKEAIALAA